MKITLHRIFNHFIKSYRLCFASKNNKEEKKMLKNNFFIFDYTIKNDKENQI